ncbi:Complement C1q-like protein 2 [Mactra antiquata]
MFFVFLCFLFGSSGALLDPDTSNGNSDHTAILQLITQEQSLRLQLESQLHDQQKQMDTLLSRVNNLTDQLTKANQQVAFFGTVGTNIPSADWNKIIKFQQITTNIGSAYNINTGVFHCPVSGIYIVSCSAIGDFGHRVSVNVYQNGNIIARPYDGGIDPAGHASGTDTAVVHANAGDEIYLKDFYTGLTYLDNQTKLVVVLIKAD